MVSSQAFSIGLRDEPFVFLLGIDEKFGHLCFHRANGSFINPHLVTVTWFRTLAASQVVFQMLICPLRHRSISQDAERTGTQNSP